MIRRWTAILLCAVLMISAGCTALAEAGSRQSAAAGSDRMADTEYSYEPQTEDVYWCATELKNPEAPWTAPVFTAGTVRRDGQTVQAGLSYEWLRCDALGNPLDSEVLSSERTLNVSSDPLFVPCLEDDSYHGNDTYTGDHYYLVRIYVNSESTARTLAGQQMYLALVAPNWYSLPLLAKQNGRYVTEADLNDGPVTMTFNVGKESGAIAGCIGEFTYGSQMFMPEQECSLGTAQWYPTAGVQYTADHVSSVMEEDRIWPEMTVTGLNTPGVSYSFSCSVYVPVSSTMTMLSGEEMKVTGKFFFNSPSCIRISQGKAVTPSETASAVPTVTGRPTVVPTTSVTAKPTSTPVNLPAVPGYQAGKLNGRTYYVKVSGSRMMFYLQRQDGTMNRVAAPYVTGSDGRRYYPADSGGVVHFPKLTDGKLTAYCYYADGIETPAIIPVGDLAKADSQQECTVNGRTYIVCVSGSRMMFYLQRKDGSLNRVAAPYASGSNGSRYYPVNCGGTVLAPQFQNERLSGYCADKAQTAALMVADLVPGVPSGSPSPAPTQKPTAAPTATATVTQKPTAAPTATAVPTPSPTAEPTPAGIISSNNGWGWHTNYSDVVYSNLYENERGGLTRVEYLGPDPDEGLVVEEYTPTYALLSSRRIPAEMNRYGGFCNGRDAYYVVWGQDNPQEDDDLEVLRISKYDRDWNKVDDLRITTADLQHDSGIQRPFGYGALRIAEAGNMLYIRGTRWTYAISEYYPQYGQFIKSSHTTSMTLAVRTTDMKLTDWNASLGGTEYVSHCMDNHMFVDSENRLILLSQGDAHPRAARLMRFSEPAGSEKIIPSFSSFDPTGPLETVDLVEFEGDGGVLFTGCSFGGLAETANGYITAYNDDGVFVRETPRDIYVAFVNKDLAEESIQKHRLTTGADAKTPQVVPTDLDGGYILWAEGVIPETESYKEELPKTYDICYTRYDANGRPGEICRAQGAVSDCQPLVMDGKVIWYVTDDSGPIFYELDESGLHSTPAAAG